MSKIPAVLPALVLVAATVTGCGSDGGTAASEADSESGTPSVSATPTPEPTTGAPAPSGTASSAPPPTARRGTSITTAGSDYGPMLFDRSGQAVYLFAKERSSTPECYGACAEAWPPVLTKGRPQASSGVRPKLLGTTQRTDGTLQVTYAGHPLYFYAHEGKNQVLCHNVSEFGGLWLVVTPAGDPAP